jgi:hypothetical protein
LIVPDWYIKGQRSPWYDSVVSTEPDWYQQWHWIGLLAPHHLQFENTITISELNPNFASDKPGIMALSRHRSQTMNASADITQNYNNENMDILFWIISCPHLYSWQMRDNLTDKHQQRNVKHIQYVHSSITFPHLPLIYI